MHGHWPIPVWLHFIKRKWPFHHALTCYLRLDRSILFFISCRNYQSIIDLIYKIWPFHQNLTCYLHLSRYLFFFIAHKKKSIYGWQILEYLFHSAVPGHRPIPVWLQIHQEKIAFSHFIMCHITRVFTSPFVFHLT